MLSEFEKEICCRIANGETVEDVASVKGVHKNTIDNALRKVKLRFDCKSLPQLIAKLVSLELLA